MIISNLLTRYILSSLWTRLFIFLIFYFTVRQLHFIDSDISIVECMPPKNKEEQLKMLREQEFRIKENIEEMERKRENTDEYFSNPFFAPITAPIRFFSTGEKFGGLAFNNDIAKAKKELFDVQEQLRHIESNLSEPILKEIDLRIARAELKSQENLQKAFQEKLAPYANEILELRQKNREFTEKFTIFETKTSCDINSLQSQVKQLEGRLNRLETQILDIKETKAQVKDLHTAQFPFTLEENAKSSVAEAKTTKFSVLESKLKEVKTKSRKSRQQR